MEIHRPDRSLVDSNMLFHLSLLTIVDRVHARTATATINTIVAIRIILESRDRQE
jgi:hypothetical protein